MRDERTWEATYDRSMRENLRSLMRHIDRDTPTAEILRIAFVRIPGLGLSSKAAIESIREEFEREHAFARADRWLNAQNEPPTIVLENDQRTLPPDRDGTVHPAEVRAVVAHRLGARVARPCQDAGGVIECAGPHGRGYRCPDCTKQRRREDDILDGVLAAWEASRETEPTTEPALESTPSTASTAMSDGEHESKRAATSATTVTDGGARDDADHDRHASTNDGETATDAECSQNETSTDAAEMTVEHDHGDTDGQSALDAFGGDTGGEHA